MTTPAEIKKAEFITTINDVIQWLPYRANSKQTPPAIRDGFLLFCSQLEQLKVYVEESRYDQATLQLEQIDSKKIESVFTRGRSFVVGSGSENVPTVTPEMAVSCVMVMPHINVMIDSIKDLTSEVISLSKSEQNEQHNKQQFFAPTEDLQVQKKADAVAEVSSQRPS